MEIKRKTPFQLQSLETFYSEMQYPTKRAMEDLAAALGLTFKQVRGWFVEKRRRKKSKDEIIVPPCSKLGEKLPVSRGRNGVGLSAAARKIIKQKDLSIHCRGKTINLPSLKYQRTSSVVENRIAKRKKKMILLQDLLTADYILKKVFRKDGPPLGVEFDSLPSKAFFHCKDSRISHPANPGNHKAPKRRKVSKHTSLDHQDCNGENAPLKKHGIGKGLMTVWRATNPYGEGFPAGIDFTSGQVTVVSPITTSVSHKPPRRVKKQQRQQVTLMRRLAKKMQDKRKPSIKRREVESNKDESQKQPRKEKCELALERMISEERADRFAMLVDDEELELRELQAGPNSLTHCDHFGTNGLHGCSLCKDLLAKFPPNSINMKQPFCVQPWDSSPETVKKLFKVFHFLYTYSVTTEICPFTLDGFAQAFHEKDSLLLGKIHVALLKLLLSDIEMELSSGIMPHSNLSCRFLALLNSVENQEFIVEFWKRSLNSLTWPEILRNVLVAAGFGSKQGALRREALSKEMNLMVKYGLRRGTLKGELFKLLSELGNSGLKVSDLARSLQIVELNLARTTEELELLICSTLSRDITLFEKISSSAYRLRINSVAKEADDFQSDTEDSGSVDDNDNGTCSSSDESECDSGHSNLGKLKHINCRHSKTNMLTVYTEIDESHPGEVWLLGLMEGEYSDLSIDEKLNVLVALVDLLSAGSSIRMEVPTKAVIECVPTTHHYGSGAKIKRSSSKQLNMPRPSWVHAGQMHGVKEPSTSSEFCPVDSSALISKFNKKETPSREGKDAQETEVDLHPIQSIFLGSDRRYNRYWLFLGPCNAYDPGHKRVYFESSEDGHWEVIDTEEALRALLSLLDDRGIREARLIASLEKREAFLCQAMSSRMIHNTGIRHSTQSDLSELDIIRDDSSSPVSDVDNNLSLAENVNDSLPPSGAIVLEAGKKGEDQKHKWSRLQDFDKWIWNYFYLDLNAVKHSRRSYFDSLTRCESCHDLYWRDEKHCKICHTTFELNFDLEERYAIHAATCREKEDTDVFPKHKVLQSQLQSLKAAIYAIESVMPEGALVGAWTKSAHRLWAKRLMRTSSLAELLQVLADFVAAINEAWLCQCNIAQDCNSVAEEIIASFPAVPQTSSAVALWLVKFDALIAPFLERVCSEKQQKVSTRCKGKHAPMQIDSCHV